MSDFDSNPFADPEAVNPFSVGKTVFQNRKKINAAGLPFELVFSF